MTVQQKKEPLPAERQGPNGNDDASNYSSSPEHAQETFHHEVKFLKIQQQGWELACDGKTLAAAVEILAAEFPDVTEKRLRELVYRRIEAEVVKSTAALYRQGAETGFIFDEIASKLFGLDRERLREIVVEEVRRCAGSAEAEEVDPAENIEPKALFNFYGPSELMKSQPASCLIDDVLPENAFAFLGGPPGVGKTFLALAWSISIQGGFPWIEHEVKKGQVIYCFGEGSRSGFKKRFQAWEVDRQQKVPEGFMFADNPPQLLNGGDVRAFIQGIEVNLETAPSLIVLDSMARCFVGGEENSAKDAGLFVDGVAKIQKRFGCTVLAVHHPTKNGAELRGSGSLAAAADSIISMEQHGHVLTLKSQKSKDRAPFADIHLRRQPIPLSEGQDSLVLVAAEPLSADSVREEILGLVSAGASGASARGLRTKEIIEYSQYKKTAVHEALKSLKEEGKIENKGSNERAEWVFVNSKKV